MASYRQDREKLHTGARGLLRLANRQEKYLMASVCLLALLLLFSVFKNISYPLFWADESMTVMGGVRVLQFGYPKVHDGKNVFYDLAYYDTSLGIDPKTDAYIGGANWGQYYVAALGVTLAEASDDLFVKTGINRTLFALFGLTGLLLLALLGARFYQSGSSRMTFLALFLFLSLLSVPLALHLREARYYALTLFLSSLVIFIYARYRILKETRYRGYLVLLAVSLVLLFLTFSPAYFVLLAAITLFEATAFAVHLAAGSSRRGLFRYHFLNMLPGLISLVAVYPLFRFFDVANISAALSKYCAEAFETTPSDMYMDNLSFIWDFFASSGLIYLAIILKIVLIGCFLGKIISIKDIRSSTMPGFVLSTFLSLFFIIYSFAIAMIPNPLYTRYFINLQPILTIIVLMDMAAILSIMKRHLSTARARSWLVIHSAKILSAVFICAVIFTITADMPLLEGHIFELTHKYEGPLDYVIPFIRNNYGNTENLVIATNYEETSFMYYLGAKTTVGYVGNNLEADATIPPDIIVLRKYHDTFNFIFNLFFKQNVYEKIIFPVYNSPVNNIPELNWEPPFQHQFKTEKTENDDEKAALYVKRDKHIL